MCTELYKLKELLLLNSIPIRFVDAILESLEIIFSLDYLGAVQAIGLFGSVAKNSYKIDSDVDLFIIYSENTDNTIKFTEKVREILHNREPISCDIIGCTFHDIKHSNRLLFKKIKEEGIILWTSQ